MHFISLIIPTFNRVTYLDKILRSIINIDPNKLKEIIIVDSYSNDGTFELIKYYQKEYHFQIIYINTINSISEKRNQGIEKSSYDFLVFLDDDCVPSKNFFEHHYKSCLDGEYVINCGNIYFSNESISNSNVIKYRNSRHLPFITNDDNHKELGFQNIVTMNMSLRKSNLLDKNLKFNNSFQGYGMEDNYFGLEAMNKGFKIVSNQASITHYDHNGIGLHTIKLYNTALGGISKFKKLNQNAVWDLNYSFFLESDYPHKNILYKIISQICRLCLNFKIAKLIRTSLIFTDKKSYLYSRTLYRYVCAAFYLKGVVDRKNKVINYENLENWYENRPK